MRVFISYKSEEYKTASLIRDFLVNDANIEVWIAPDCIPTGGDYSACIPDAIRKSDSMILLLTARAVESPWIQKELRTAINFRKTVYPIMLEDFDLPDSFLFTLEGCQYTTVGKDRNVLSEIKRLFTSGAAAGTVQERVAAPTPAPEPSLPAVFEKISEGTIQLGTYPQSEVTDSSLKAALNRKAGMLPNEQNSYLWTSYHYYIESTPSDFMWYIDIEHGGEKYRGVYFTRYKPFWTKKTSNAVNSNQSLNNYPPFETYWFKYEPIRWRILRESENEALVICDALIDNHQFYYSDFEVRTKNGKTVYANNYEYSDLRRWLNEDFYQFAFSKDEQKLILTSLVENGPRTTENAGNAYACRDTEDKLYLLSYEEASTDLFGFDENRKRQKRPTPYAKCQGAYTDSSNACGLWWLRSPSPEKSELAKYVFMDGDLENDFVVCTGSCICPVMKIRTRS